MLDNRKPARRMFCCFVAGEKIMKGRGSLSINKTVLNVMMAGYCIILIMLTCMDWFLITNYQRDKRKTEQGVLNKYILQADESMVAMDTIIYDVYANNANFAALSGVLTELERYNNIYELDKTLRNRVILEEHFQGYLIYYSAVENVRYYSDTNIISAGDIELIQENVKIQIESVGNNWQRFILATENNKCFIVIYKQDNASICGIYSFGKMEDNIKKDTSESTDVYFIDNGYVMDGQNDDVEELGILDNIKMNESQFTYYKEKHYVYGQKVKNSGLWICMAIPTDFWSLLNMPQLLLLVLTACSAFLIVVLYRFMKVEFVRPLRELVATMNRIRQGDWHARVDKDARFREVQEVNETLAAMVGEIEKQKMLSYEQTIEKQKAQLQYLQLQLKPHFYLNGLKTLNMLVMENEGEKMQELILHLSHHLRYLMQAEREMVTLRQEIDYVNNYLFLQKNMTDRNFSLKWETEEELMSCEIPNLCLHTFVENSFQYAKLGSAQYELTIKISIQKLDTEEGEFLDIQVSDNGIGYPENILDEINAAPGESGTSIGINNLKRRCSLLYEGREGYYFFNRKGAVSELMLPKNQRIKI